ncbi:nucleoside hydrolase [Porifericola rhodea]|uniref:nucleoside hydrolase n=1 Tax=Porifericola rhodea TaxID=930972 RepID=UPI002665E960|nr:nucleoside hydrolase [Porifericola rhodea]WKN31599.1 nucleoside hydrolase [Porifericola rhodea]
MSNSQPRKKVFLDHDGGVDDLLALLLVLTMEEVDLIGVSVTPADCYADSAAESSRKFIDLMMPRPVGVAISQARGMNPFPDVWRAQPQIINAFPQLLNMKSVHSPLSELEASDFIISQLMQCEEPVSYLMTGPCTTFVNALRKEPAIKDKISEIVWMAGAVDVHGNVRTYTHNGSAEWNVYWDPAGAQWLIEQNLPLTIVPLDATNHVPVTFDFLEQMASQHEYDVSYMASFCWAITVNTIPGYDYLYHMWDVLAAAVVTRKDIFTVEKMELEIAQKLPNQGETIAKPGSGSWVNVVTDASKDEFYNYLLAQSRKNFVRK